MSNDSPYLFVYGTLQPGFVNTYARFLRQNSQYAGKATLPGQLFDLGEYPGAIYIPDALSVVHGTVYNIGKNKAILIYLDEYEGVSNPPEPSDEYVRTTVPVRCNGDVLLCCTYLYNWPTYGKRLIESGRYEL